jgi:hypothetical protein
MRQTSEIKLVQLVLELHSLATPGELLRTPLRRSSWNPFKARFTPARKSASGRSSPVGFCEACYNAVTSNPTAGNYFLGPARKRGEVAHTDYALLGTRAAGGARRPDDRLGPVPVGPALDVAKSIRKGRSEPVRSAKTRRRGGARVTGYYAEDSPGRAAVGLGSWTG